MDLRHESRPGSHDGLDNRINQNLYRERISSDSSSTENKGTGALPSRSMLKSGVSQEDIGKSQHLHQEATGNHRTSVHSDVAAPGNTRSEPPNVSTLAASYDKAITIIQTSESKVNRVANSIDSSHPPKVDYAADLFRMLSAEDSKPLETAITNTWVDCELEDASAGPKETTMLKPSESQIHPEVITGNFSPKNGLVWVTNSIKDASKDSVQGQKHMKNDIMLSPSSKVLERNLSSKEIVPHSNSIHHQRLSLLNQADTPYATQPHVGFETQLANLRKDQFNGIAVPSQNGLNINQKIPHAHLHSTEMPKNMQMQNLPLAYFTGNNFAPYRTSSNYNGATTTSLNGTTTAPLSSPGGARWGRPVLLVSGHDYDFSLLTQGFLTKR